MKKRIVFIHGFMEKHSMWNPLLPIPADKIYSPDLPGHGENNDYPSVLSMDYTADLIASELREDPGYKSLFIGHSMGGYIAAAIAKKHPDLVDGIIMFQSSARSDSPQKQIDRERAIAAVKDNQRRYCGTMIRGLFNEEKEAMFSDKIKQLTDEACKMDTAAIVAALSGMKLREDNTEVLRNRKFFLAYIIGDADKRLPLIDMLDEIREIKPDFHEVINNCGHMAQWESPEEARELLTEAIRQFDAFEG